MISSGSAYSDQPGDPALWRIEWFREEVEQVRTALGLEDFYLYGHSWGGMLAIEYALKYQRHLKGLVISNMTASVQSYVTYLNQLRKAFPSETREVLAKYEAAGNYEAQEYQELMFKQIYTKHLCRINPFPEPLARTLRHPTPSSTTLCKDLMNSSSRAHFVTGIGGLSWKRSESPHCCSSDGSIQ
jgi:proline iminopeptidase